MGSLGASPPENLPSTSPREKKPPGLALCHHAPLQLTSRASHADPRTPFTGEFRGNYLPSPSTTPDAKMSRSAADATRFTATGPYANSKPYDLSNSAKVKSSADKNARVQHTGPDGKPETPKQKVERLRAQARAARMASSASGADRWIESGRKFANKAHKAVVYSLIAASGTW